MFKIYNRKIGENFRPFIIAEHVLTTMEISKSN